VTLDSVEGYGERKREITPTKHADKFFGGMFSTQLKDKAARSERDSRQNRLQRGLWRKNSKGMTYEGRQEYFKVQHKRKDKEACMSTQPEREAKMEKKGKEWEWKNNLQVIEGVS
jgi:hypothetical protein